MPRQRWLAMALVLALALALVPAPAAGETAAPAAPAAGDTTAPVAPEAGDTSAPAAPAAGNTSAPAAPAAGTDPAVAAAETLRALGIVTGDDRGLRLQDRITRAEIVTILVRASGLAYLEPLNREVYSFPDVAGHWSRGFVAVARSQGYIAGRGDGRFYPDAEVTHAEAVTLVVRLAGIEVTETDWPHNYFRAAEAAGILPMDLDLAAAPNQPALRGTVFRLVDAAMRVARDESGRNLYQRHHDAEAPTITLTAPTGPVEAAGADATVTVEGTVRENRRLARLEVAGIPVPVGEDGHFRVNVPVPADGEPIAVVATDAAGNVARVEIPVAAGPRPAAAIEIEVEGTLELTVGESREVPVQVLDDRGQPIPDAALTGEVVGGIGTFDPETRTFTATRSGSGYLELRSGEVTARVPVQVVSPVARLEITPAEATVARLTETSVTFRAYDDDGRLVAVEPEWTLEPQSGAVFDNGVFVAWRPGVYTLTARALGTEAKATFRVYGEPARLELRGPDELVASEGAEVMFTAVVVDERGTPVLSHSEPITLAVAGNRPGIAVEPIGPLADGAQRFRVRTTGGLSLVGLVYDLEASTLTPEGEALVARKTVEMVPQQAAGIRVEAPAYLAVNTGEELAPVSIWVVDQTGRPVSYGLWELEVTVTGPAVLEGGVAEGKVTYAGSPDPAPAVVRLRPLKGRPGEIRVTVSLDDVEPATATIQGVVAQAASRVALAAEPNGARAAADYVDPEGRYAPEAIGLTVTTTDPTGVPVLGPAEATVEVIAPRPGALAELDIAYVDPLTGRPGEWIPLQSLGGRYTVSLTGGQARLLLRSRGYVGDLTLRAWAPGLAEGSARVTFTPGPAYQIAFAEGTDLVYVPAGTETFRLQVQVQDFHGNPTPAGGLPITFTASHPEVKLNGKRRTATVTADAQGLAAVEVSLPPGTGTYTITASADGLAGGLARASMTVEVRYAVPHTIQVQFLDAGGQRRTAVPAGEPVTVKAIVTDPHGARVSDLPASALRFAVTEGDLAHDKPEPTGFVAHGNGEYTAVIYPGRGPLTVEVAVPVAGGVRRGTGRLQVSAGPAARVQLVRSGDEGIAVDAYRPTGPFLLRVTDAYGNPAYAQADIIVTFSATGLSAGAYFDVRETPSSAPVTVTGGLTLRATKSIYILAGGDADGRFTLVVTPVTPGVEGDEVPVTIR